MLAIYKREVKAYFRSIIGFLFMAVTLFFVSLYFVLYNLMGGYPYISYALSGVLFMFLITIPVLTMRSLAEERRNKTDQLILTAPVSVGGIVVGKFLAMLTVFAIPVAVVCAYPLLLTRYGAVPMRESYLAILGFFLYGMAAIAIGPLIRMKFVCQLTKEFGVKTVVSMNPIMIDGTGMCGGCRLTLNRDGKRVTKFACVDGPDFNGYEVDFDEAMSRGSMYRDFEKHAYEETCNLFRK